MSEYRSCRSRLCFTSSNQTWLVSQIPHSTASCCVSDNIIAPSLSSLHNKSTHPEEDRCNTPTGILQKCLLSSLVQLILSLDGAGVFWTDLSAMAGKNSCPCCPNAEGESMRIPVRASLATTLAPADRLWTSSRDEAVRLRVEGSGPGSATPVTVHQMFLETVENRGDYPALVFKKDGESTTLTWRQYYEQCRAAAKSFLKVRGFCTVLCKKYTTVWMKNSLIMKYEDG